MVKNWFGGGEPKWCYQSPGSEPAPAHIVNLKVGSSIELLAADGTKKYGSIKWMGHVPQVEAEVAGIELIITIIAQKPL